jgi:hypothetical protein
MKSSLIIFAVACYALLGLTLFDFSGAENAGRAIRKTI